MLGPLNYLTLILSLASSSTNPREGLLDILHQHPEGHHDPVIRAKFANLLESLAQQEEHVHRKDVLFRIGSDVYGIDLPAPAAGAAEDHEEDPESIIVGFDFMKQFMKDVFLSYGVPEDRATTCADVLVEADKRGIDSHGLGRLKPIYCDRMDQGILQASPPIDIIKETPTTALVDGNLGLGLYIGPYCMQLAIQKAKQYGLGFVVARRSTHYGIAGYYATMATDQGCIGWTGTNARPSIAPTYGGMYSDLHCTIMYW
jgi:hypothetical protein